MTIEIRELVIQAQVTRPSSEPTTSFVGLDRNEQDRLVEEISRQVWEQFRENQERIL